jgi:CDP-diacylglycerol---glycerol-3-phosphate 3-phosphatidyltransferase
MKINKSSTTMFQPLIEEYPNQIELYLYHTPNMTGIKRFLPERINEIIGFSKI